MILIKFKTRLWSFMLSCSMSLLAEIEYVKTKVSCFTCRHIICIDLPTGGTVFPIGVKKQLRMQEIAAQNNIPCIYIIDSGGGFLPLQSEVFPDKEQGGRAFYNEAVMNAGGIPQVQL